VYTRKTLNFFFKKTKCKPISIKINLVDKIWQNKKKTKISKFYVLPDEEAGQDCKFKVKKLVSELDKNNIDFQFVSSSENIAWLLNIRGQDSDFTPIPNSYLSIDSEKKVNLFCNLKKVDNYFKKKLKDVKLINIELIDQFLLKVKNKNILIDSSSCSLHFEKILSKNNKFIEIEDPIYLLKSVKNRIEIKNTIKSHVLDGVALTKFLFWLKKNYKKKRIHKISAQKKLLEFRKKNKKFRFPSFPTISGSGPNGAIIHYKASKKSNRRLKKGDIYLVDSGGQYKFGTTDVTRTISLNNNNRIIKDILTRVLRGHIAVANYKINKNTNGSQIDRAARRPLKEANLNYAHGTGHGVGYFLNVHEGPQAISKNNKVNFKEGMIVSNEPGYYENGKFGIRIENLIRVKKENKGFSFVNLTMVPIDKSLINKNIMRKNEINWLNNYHLNVFKKIKGFMNKSELLDLTQACSKI